MKTKIYLISFAVIMLAGCTKPLTLTVSNPSLIERNNTLAEISLQDLGLTLEQLQQKALFNDKGEKLAYQVMYYGQAEPQSVVFLVDNIRGGMLRRYTLRNGKPLPVPQVCTAQFVAERKDDFAWENDLAAYRMYGPALAAENPSNGVDLWLKCTDKPVVAQFYDDDLHHGKPYHVNHGEGLDCYKVAHTLGCGGIAPYINGKLSVLDHYTSYQIIEAGGLRCVFRLTYPTHTLTVTTDAGSQLNKAVVEVRNNPEQTQTISNDTEAQTWAAGIYLHDKIDNVSFSEQGGWAAYAENAVSDAGEPEGRNYCAVYVPGAEEIKVEEGHLLVIAGPAADNAVTYWFGGGWSKWHYPTDATWFSATAEFAHNALLPLQVKVAEE
ncbi:MAG: DUF4861 family protein [Paludibacteraceae bacterium]|nr:DUF4861 family protein [Paludibacteraceae bacterium]